MDGWCGEEGWGEVLQAVSAKVWGVAELDDLEVLTRGWRTKNANAFQANQMYHRPTLLLSSERGLERVRRS